MLRGIFEDLNWMARMALANMMSASSTWENRAVASYQLDDLRDERPDLV